MCWWGDVLAASVGGIVGYSLVWGGASAVTWHAPTSRFPYMTGVSPLAVAWVVSPLAAGLTCFLLFLGLRAAVLRRAYSLNIAFCVSGRAAGCVRQHQLHGLPHHRSPTVAGVACTVHCQYLHHVVLATKQTCWQYTHLFAPAATATAVPQALPLFMFLTVFVGVLLILAETPAVVLPGGTGTAAAIAAGAGVVAAFVGAGLMLPWLLRCGPCGDSHELLAYYILRLCVGLLAAGVLCCRDQTHTICTPCHMQAAHNHPPPLVCAIHDIPPTPTLHCTIILTGS